MTDAEFEAWVKTIQDEAYKRLSVAYKCEWGGLSPEPLEVLEAKPGRCECGSESAGSYRHSTWCPKFEK